jgi:ATP-dependent exoDNAse (exonuclease V) beta subunit
MMQGPEELPCIKILEEYIQGQGYLDLTETGLNAHNMAIKIIENGLSSVTEYYGLEATLYYPGLYAGATDMVAVHKGQDAIIDFKQTNKVKKREWIEDYCLQLAGYAMAHNFIYRTSINQRRDNDVQQRFILSGICNRRIRVTKI